MSHKQNCKPKAQTVARNRAERLTLSRNVALLNPGYESVLTMRIPMLRGCEACREAGILMTSLTMYCPYSYDEKRHCRFMKCPKCCVDMCYVCLGQAARDTKCLELNLKKCGPHNFDPCPTVSEPVGAQVLRVNEFDWSDEDLAPFHPDAIIEPFGEEEMRDLHLRLILSLDDEQKVLRRVCPRCLRRGKIVEVKKNKRRCCNTCSSCGYEFCLRTLKDPSPACKDANCQRPFASKKDIEDWAE